MHQCVYMHVAISAPHLAPLTAWQDLALGEDGMRDGGERDRVGGERGWRVKGREEGCLGAVQWHTAGEGAMKARMRWASPGDYLCFHVLLSFTCSPNSDWLAGLQTYCPSRHAKTITSPTSSISCCRYALTLSGLVWKGLFIFLEMKFIADGWYFYCPFTLSQFSWIGR